MAKAKKVRQPKEKVSFGKISLALWENSNGDGDVFESFSLNKTVVRRDDNDRTRFTGQIISLNGLTKNDLSCVKQAIAEMESKVLGVDDLEESG